MKRKKKKSVGNGWFQVYMAYQVCWLSYEAWAIRKTLTPKLHSIQWEEKKCHERERTRAFLQMFLTSILFRHRTDEVKLVWVQYFNKCRRWSAAENTFAVAWLTTITWMQSLELRWLFFSLSMKAQWKLTNPTEDCIKLGGSEYPYPGCILPFTGQQSDSFQTGVRLTTVSTME